MTPTDKKYLAEIKARADAATPPDWLGFAGCLKHTGGLSGVNGPDCKTAEQSADSKFIAHARQDIPKLLAMVQERDAEVAQLKLDHSDMEVWGKENLQHAERLRKEVQERDAKIFSDNAAHELAVDNMHAALEENDRLRKQLEVARVDTATEGPWHLVTEIKKSLRDAYEVMRQRKIENTRLRKQVEVAKKALNTVKATMRINNFFSIEAMHDYAAKALTELDRLENEK